MPIHVYQRIGRSVVVSTRDADAEPLPGEIPERHEKVCAAGLARMEAMIPVVEETLVCSVKHAKKRLGLQAETVTKFLRKGKLAGYKRDTVWFIYLDDLARLEAEREAARPAQRPWRI